MSSPKIDKRIVELCRGVTAKRARTVIDHILKHGHITTEELKEKYKYDHPPRAARDVREQGVPLETFRIKGKRTGRMIGAYRFGDPSKITQGRIGGRRAFSKAFKKALIDRYGEVDSLTAQRVGARYLQIDHRVPYEVAGDGVHDEKNLDAYMLLDASSQRAKSWTCERCENWRDRRDPTICRECYWAYPERYKHMAMIQARRTDILWIGEETAQYDALAQEAEQLGVRIPTLIKRRLKG